MYLLRSTRIAKSSAMKTTNHQEKRMTINNIKYNPCSAIKVALRPWPDPEAVNPTDSASAEGGVALFRNLRDRGGRETEAENRPGNPPCTDASPYSRLCPVRVYVGGAKRVRIVLMTFKSLKRVPKITLCPNEQPHYRTCKPRRLIPCDLKRVGEFHVRAFNVGNGVRTPYLLRSRQSPGCAAGRLPFRVSFEASNVSADGTVLQGPQEVEKKHRERSPIVLLLEFLGLVDFNLLEQRELLRPGLVWHVGAAFACERGRRRHDFHV